MRKMISFKIENLPDKDRKIVDDWAEGQKNIQQSLANLVMHVVGYVGNADVMEFDVQRKLHTIFAANEVINVTDPIMQRAAKPVQVPQHQDQSKPKENPADQGEYEEYYPTPGGGEKASSKMFDE